MPEPSHISIVLFDIDGTLVAGPRDGPSAGVLAMNAASLATTGKESVRSGAEYAGRTDPLIARMLLSKDAEHDSSGEGQRSSYRAYTTTRIRAGSLERRPARLCLPRTGRTRATPDEASGPAMTWTRG